VGLRVADRRAVGRRTNLRALLERAVRHDEVGAHVASEGRVGTATDEGGHDGDSTNE
jgi:hypothetical protein